MRRISTLLRQLEVAAIAMLFAVAVPASTIRAYAADVHDPSLSFPPATFTIISPDTNSAIGQLRYTSEKAPGGVIVRGESRFTDGQSDMETSRLRIAETDALPVLVEFDHSFYDKSGTLIRRGHANLKTGAASCFIAEKGESNPGEPLNFPPDTWAGASVLLPIEHYLRAGETGTQHLHVFTCAPDPRVLPIDVDINPTAIAWPALGLRAVRVDVKPDFGWLDVIVAPFVPKLHAWFAPSDDWNFVGGDMARFYRGPNITLVITATSSRAAPIQSGQDGAARR